MKRQRAMERVVGGDVIEDGGGGLYNDNSNDADI